MASGFSDEIRPRRHHVRQQPKPMTPLRGRRKWLGPLPHAIKAQLTAWQRQFDLEAYSEP
jgi:hypothetical protein